MSETSRLRKKLTTIFNKYIRLRDRAAGCISCQIRPVQNAGHFRSTGRAPHGSMRYDEQNVNGQCIYCNYTLGGNEEGYKAGLVRKYGPGIIERLDVKRSCRQNPWTVWEYESMIKTYQQKINEMGGA